MKTPVVLALDGALGPFSAALLGGSHIATRAAAGNDALEQGLALIDELCEEARVAVGEVDALAVGVGPGGFTGLRITLAFAKALALAIGCPLVGVSSFDVVAECSAEQDVAYPHRALIIRPRAQVYCTRIHDGDTIRSFGGNLTATVAELAAYPDIGIAALPMSAVHELLAAGVRAEALTTVDVLPALCIARNALRRISAHGIAALPSAHAVRADYGEAPAAKPLRAPA